MGDPLYAGIEGGGTKFRCAIASSPPVIDAEFRVDTGEPAGTLDACVEFVARYSVRSVGLAIFGPLDLRSGTLLKTPKPGWSHFPVRAHLEERLHVPVFVDTDVNAAALAELRWGAARGVGSVLYITVGAGIGGGLVIDGKPVHGLMHPELGHIPISVDDNFGGACPFHGRCLEGMASGRAIEVRTGRRADALGPDHPVFDVVAQCLAQGVAAGWLVASPEIVVLGGGVMNTPGLLGRVREKTQRLLHGYIPKLDAELNSRLVAPGLGANSGLLGALALTPEDARSD